jgi:alpha-tubulin suppressor-like RCC1 family protein/alpha-acetolactate decarboxylase
LITKLKLPSRFLAVALCFLLSFADLPGTIAAAGGTPPIPVQASSGFEHSLLRFNDGSVWSWGYNVEGEAGHPPEQTVITTPAKIQNLENITEISAGGYHNLALKEDKTVWAWGTNEKGQLAQVTSVTYNHIPTQVMGELDSGFGDIKSISAGYDHSLALKQDGTVWAWGSNELGKLGQTVDPQNPATTMISVPVKLKVKDDNDQDVDFDQVIAIAAGAFFSVALKDDGTVWGWGKNLGSTPVRIDGLNNIVQISAGNGFILALDAGGNVWGWGNNLNGQLGINSTTAWIDTPEKVKDELGTGFLSNIKAVSTFSKGANTSNALSHDGTVYSVGLNTAGRLGDGTTTQRILPVKVVGISNIVAIGPGLEHGLAIGGDGKIYTWGNNAYGQLGNGSTINRTTPLKGSSIISSITLNTSTLQLKIGEPAAQLTPTIELNNPLTSGTIEWSSSDETVATVDTSGLVTAQGPGTATINAAASDNSSINASSQVTVLDNNAGLAALNLSGINITPSVSADVYTATVPYAVTSTTVTATAASSKATVSALKLNDNPVTNPVGLSVGSNVITVEITTEDGTVKPYRVTVTRQPKSNNAGIGTLSLSGIVMSSTVSSSVYDYTATVANSIDSTTITATAAHPLAVVTALKLNGDPVTNSIGLSVGSNVITVEVTAEDGTVQPYSVTVTRQLPAPSITSVAAGDGHVDIDWNGVYGSVTYAVYQREAQGSYGTAIAIVDASVLQYDALGLTNGRTYYFMVKAMNPGGESDSSNEVSATPQVPAPGVPNLLTAESGNAAITLTWAPVSGSTGYNIYQRLGSDTYGAEVATVTGSVYSHEVTGLTNGTMYNFTIKAINPGGISDPSDEVSATPMTVPSAPTEVRAVSGNGQATITFTAPDDHGGSPITGYEVTVLPDHRTVTGHSSPITITGLTNGRAYTFVVRAINSVGLSTASVESNAVTPYSPSSSNNNGASPQTPSAPARSTTEGIEVLINGKPEQAGIAATTEKNGRTIRTITLDPKKLGDRLQAEGSRSVITIPFSTPSDVMIGVLNGQMIKDMEVKQQTIEIRTEKATYTLPALQINIDAISERIGREVDLEQIQIEIEISEPTEEQLKIVENAVHQGAYTLVVPPLNFSVRASYGDVTVDVSKFNAYVSRTFAIPDGVDPNKITTGVVIDPDGTVRHVPTKIDLIDGKYYATINSLTNSTYALIWKPVAFKDVVGHWAEEAVNEMGSRMVVSGIDDDLYNPNQAITRAEFAAIIVRAMGLKENRGATPFSDVRSSDWYSGAVLTALDYGLISGYEDGTFRPQQRITREQAMVMIARAMEVTGLSDKLPDKDANKIMQSYVDAIQVSVWARDSVADVLQAGIITGRSNSQLAPQAFITRAEVAVIIQRLLQQSKLI